MLVSHPHNICNQAGFRDIATKSGNPGHNWDIRQRSGASCRALDDLFTYTVKTPV